MLNKLIGTPPRHRGAPEFTPIGSRVRPSTNEHPQPSSRALFEPVEENTFLEDDTFTSLNTENEEPPSGPNVHPSSNGHSKHMDVNIINGFSSIKEQEERIRQLDMENYRLKLNMASMQRLLRGTPADTRQLMTENVNLKAELDQLVKRLQESRSENSDSDKERLVRRLEHSEMERRRILERAEEAEKRLERAEQRLERAEEVEKRLERAEQAEKRLLDRAEQAEMENRRLSQRLERAEETERILLDRAEQAEQKIYRAEQTESDKERLVKKLQEEKNRLEQRQMGEHSEIERELRHSKMENEKLSERVQRSEMEIERLQQRVAMEREKLQKSYTEAQYIQGQTDELKKFRERLEHAENERKNSEAECKRLTERLKRAESERQEVDRLRSRLEHTSAQVRTLQEQIQQYKSTNDDISLAKNQLEEYRRENRSLKSRLQDYERDIAHLKAQTSVYDQGNDHWRLQQLLEEEQKKTAALKHECAMLEAQARRQPVEAQQLSRLESQNASLRRAKSDLEDQVSRLEASLQAGEKALRILEGEFSRYKADAETEFTRYKAEADARFREIDELEQEMRRVREKQGSVESEELEYTKRSLRRAKEELMQKDSKIKACEKTLEMAQKEARDAGEAVLELEDRLVQTEAVVEQLRHELQRPRKSPYSHSASSSTTTLLDIANESRTRLERENDSLVGQINRLKVMLNTDGSLEHEVSQLLEANEELKILLDRCANRMESAGTKYELAGARAQVDEMKAELAVARAQVDTLTTSLEASKQSTARTRADLEQAEQAVLFEREKRISAQEKAMEKTSALEREISMLSEKAFERTEKKLDLEKEYERKVSSLESEKRALSLEIGVLNSRLKALEVNKDPEDAVKSLLEVQVQEATKLTAELTQSLSDTNAANTRLEERIKTLDQEARTNAQAKTSLEKKVKELTQDLLRTTRHYRSLADKLNRNSLADSMSKLSVTDTKLKGDNLQLQRKVSAFENEITYYKARLHDFNMKCNDLQMMYQFTLDSIRNTGSRLRSDIDRLVDAGVYPDYGAVEETKRRRGGISFRVLAKFVLAGVRIRRRYERGEKRRMRIIELRSEIESRRI